MVLEDASNPTPSDFTSESTPASDLDPYAGSNAEFLESRPSSYVRVQDSTPPIYVNLANLPRPFLVSANPKNDARIFRHYGDQIKKIVDVSTKLVQRPLTQEEADALAFNFATSFRISSYGLPLGVTLATVQFLRTMRTFRFPFFTPFKEGGRLSPDRFGPLRGRSARWTWHTSRGAAYGMFTGIFLGPTITGLYAVSQSMSARVRDPRLKDIMEAAQRRGQQMRQQNAQQRQSMEETERANQRGESPEMSQKRWEARMEEAKKRRASAATPVDDMSPTGGAFADDIRSQSDGFVSDDWQTQQDSQPWQDSTTSTATSTTPSSNPTQPSTSRPQRPSGPTSTQASSSTKQSGSAWDRLRQDALSSSDQSKPAPSSTSRSQSISSSQSPSSGSGSDSFSFSQGGEDKQLAKSEAQKEFDARVEREREGKDFDEGSRGGKRW